VPETSKATLHLLQSFSSAKVQIM